MRVQWKKEISAFQWIVFRYPIAVGILILGTFGAMSLHPHRPFDWPYTVVSSLASNRDNPHGYTLFSSALVCCGWLLFFLPDFFSARLPNTGATRLGTRALRLGFLFMIAVGLERLFPHFLVRYEKAHEALAFFAFFDLTLGVVIFWCQVHLLRRYRFLWFGLAFTLVPFLGAVASQAYLYFNPVVSGWVHPGWRALQVPFYLSFAFWQWAVCLWVFTYLYLILLLLGGSQVKRDFKR